MFKRNRVGRTSDLLRRGVSIAEVRGVLIALVPDCLLPIYLPPMRDANDNDFIFHAEDRTPIPNS